MLVTRRGSLGLQLFTGLSTFMTEQSGQSGQDGQSGQGGQTVDRVHPTLYTN